MTDNINELVAKARTGDEDAFAALVQKYTSYLYRTAYALLQDSLEAEDAVQEAFIKVYRSLAQLTDNRAFHSWLTKITTNICLDRLKKHRPVLVQESYLELSNDDSYRHWDLRLMVQDALKQIGAEYRQILILREWQGYDYQEISSMLNLPLGTVKSRIHTARLRLKKILTDSASLKE